MMPNWQGILNEHKTRGSNFDIIRRKYLGRIHKITGRNVIAYYSAWLQRRGDGIPTAVEDNDKNGFMNAVFKLTPSAGLDLILHTPGGDAAATESLVSYLRSIFGTNIRAIVPQLAMSAGTMIACACNTIIMGKQSSLGPIDPQIGGLPAHGVVEEFKRALDEISKNQAAIPIWQPIISRYYPTLVGECEKAIQWANEMVEEWLKTGMFKSVATAKKRNDIAEKVVSELSDHALTKSHARHLDIEKCKAIGLKIETLENIGKVRGELQDAVLSLHHCMMQVFSELPIVKIIENHRGSAFITGPGSIVIR